MGDTDVGIDFHHEDEPESDYPAYHARGEHIGDEPPFDVGPSPYDGSIEIPPAEDGMSPAPDQNAPDPDLTPGHTPATGSSSSRSPAPDAPY